MLNSSQRTLHRAIRRIGAAVILCAVATSSPANADIFSDFIDPTDQQFDVSNFLLNKRGVLFVPSIITEPAVGIGGGGALLYFHKQKDDAAKAESGEKLGMPPSISAIAGLGTQNGTWAVGGGHFGSWRKDSIRYTGGLGYSSANLDFYAGSTAFKYNLKGIFLLQDIAFRIRNSPVFMGARYLYAHFDSSFKDAASLPPFLKGSRTDNLGGLGIDLIWDTRDVLLDPKDGEYFLIQPIFFGPWMGGDDWFQTLVLKARSFNKIHERFNLNVRVDASLSFMNTPFYALPRINLRGVSATRYQAPYTGEGELEGQLRVWKRWSLVGFFGVGWRAGEKYVGDKPDNVVPAGGGGFRYEIARQLGLDMGMDFAGSRQQFAFYFQVGTSWR